MEEEDHGAGSRGVLRCIEAVHETAFYYLCKFVVHRAGLNFKLALSDLLVTDDQCPYSFIGGGHDLDVEDSVFYFDRLDVSRSDSSAFLEISDVFRRHGRSFQTYLVNRGSLTFPRDLQPIDLLTGQAKKCMCYVCHVFSPVLINIHYDSRCFPGS